MLEVGTVLVGARLAGDELHSSPSNLEHPVHPHDYSQDLATFFA